MSSKYFLYISLKKFYEEKFFLMSEYKSPPLEKISVFRNSVYFCTYPFREGIAELGSKR